MDILQEIPTSELKELAKFFLDECQLPYVHNFVKSVHSWKVRAPKENYMTFFAINGNWRNHGTFIALVEFHCYNIFVYSIEENTEVVYNVLANTKRFHYDKNHTIFFNLHKHYFPMVKKFIQDRHIEIKDIKECDVLWMSQGKAINLEINIPNDVCIKPLTSENISLVNELWSSKYDGSEQFLRIIHKMGKSYGVFIKGTQELASWIFKNHLGQLGVLQTVEKHKRKGYGSLLTLFMSKEVAKEGLDPVGMVLTCNQSSKTMFENCGFVSINRVKFIECAEAVM